MNAKAVTLSLLLLGLSFVGLSSCSSSSGCTDVACGPSAHFQNPIHFQGSADQLALTVCLNGACVHGTATTSGCTIDSTADFTVACRTQVVNGSTSIFFDVSSGSSDTFRDGDIYVFRVVRGPTSESLIDVTKSASYKTTRPNGLSCPPVCKSTDVS